jgi:alkaline phosphatase
MNTHGCKAEWIGRRAFLERGVLSLAAGGVLGSAATGAGAARSSARPKVRFGLITDLHYADKPSAGDRHYRETPEKLAEAASRLREDPPDFLVELGDLIDSSGSVATDLKALRRISQDVSAASEKRHYVLGNHCVELLTKDEFLGGVGQERSFYSFDSGGCHFIVLDGCFRADGEPYGRANSEWTDANIPPHEVDWLRDDLAGASSPTFVFAHQRLDVGRPYGFGNAPEIRGLLKGSGKVRAVFQGHSHKNDYHEIAGIHYVTLVAMVEGSGAENNGYASVDVHEDGSIQVHGFRKQRDYHWS